MKQLPKLSENFQARILNGEQVPDEELLQNPYLTPTKDKDA